MSSRAVLPPSVLPQGAENETMSVLATRLSAAESDTKQLVEQLQGMGFSYDEQATGDIIKPFAPRMASNEVLHKNYENLVSRVCKAESAVHTLKLNMMRLQAQQDFANRDKNIATDKLATASEAYDKEIKKLNRDLATAKKESKESAEKQRCLEDNVRRLQQALEEATAHQTVAAADYDEIKTSRSRLQRQAAQLKEDVAREASLRASLETSHNTLLLRVKEMEAVVEAERGQLRSLSEKSATLQRDSEAAREQSEAEKTLRLQYEDRITKLYNDREALRDHLNAVSQEKQLLVGELGRIKAQYTDLNSQLDAMNSIIEERQSLQTRLEKENESLKKAMKDTANQNAQMIAQQESQNQLERELTSSRMQDEQLKTELQEKLREETREKVQAQHSCGELRSQLAELERKLRGAEDNVQATETQLQQTILDLKTRVGSLEREKERALKDKQSLLDEVNQAVDSMSEERGRLEQELTALKVELAGQQQQRQQLEDSNRQLLDRQQQLEAQQSGVSQIEASLADMLEQKNRLAYDKGRLASRVEALQAELETSAGAAAELAAVRRNHTALETKHQKILSDLGSAQLTIQRLEAQVRQIQNTGDRKEKDFELAIRARDEAVAEASRLQEQIDSLETRHKQKAESMGTNLAETREDHKQLTGTLEALMKSHGQLQAMVEGLQGQLGGRDADIAQLKQEKLDLEHVIRRQKKEAEALQNKMAALQTFETTDVGPLRSELNQCKTDNGKMAASLDKLLKSNSQLQAEVDGLTDKLERARHVLQQTKDARAADEENHARELQTYEERMSGLKQQLATERAKAVKRTHRDVADVKRQLDDLVAKNGELSRTNTELRHRLTEMEIQSKEQKEKMASQKQLVEHLKRVKAKQEDSITSLQGVSEQVTEMERIKNDYMKKTKTQAQTIQHLMAQMAGLQAEVKTLAEAQLDSTQLISEQEETLARERQAQEAWRRKCKESQRREADLERLRHLAEQKLAEVGDESVLLADTDSASAWFRNKLTGLQTELTRHSRPPKQNQKPIVKKKSHKFKKFDTDSDHDSDYAATSKSPKVSHSHGSAEREKGEMAELLEEEKAKAEETARRAQRMIKASRETIARLADCAEVAHRETTSQLSDMKRQLAAERDAARRAERRLREFQDASMRHTEQLAAELSSLRQSQTSAYMDDSSS